MQKLTRLGQNLLVLIKKACNYTVRDDLMPEQLENINDKIKKPNSVPIFVCTWYRPARFTD